MTPRSRAPSRSSVSSTRGRSRSSSTSGPHRRRGHGVTRRKIRHPRYGYAQPYLLFAIGLRRSQAFPLVHVRLRGPRGSLRTVALVDSGSTVTFVPPDLVEELGVPAKPGPKAGGGGGDFRTWDAWVNIEVLHQKKVIASFRRLRVSVPREEGRIPYIVLGRDSLFRAFWVQFQEDRARLILKPRLA